ncbi:MAG: restriction endonuclease subunit S [Gemmatimonadetes bacterium]|nr:restriction endonuclease subunit S [Gemmatimonadota bacterium]
MQKAYGTDWLEFVPTHWKIVRLRHLVTCLDGKRVPLAAAERGKMLGPYPYWGANRIIDHINDYLFDEELVLLGEDGAPFLARDKPVAFFSQGKVWPNNHIHVLRPRDSVQPAFLAYALNCVDYARYIGGATRDKLTQSQMKALPIPVPVDSEQRAIVRFLDHADRRIQRYIRAKERLIELLEEQKQAIIHQAVTGQIDVRTGQPYPAYKDSGVEWLGEVPEHWEVGPLKRFVARGPGAIKAGPFGSQLTSAEMAGADYKVYTQRNVIKHDLDGGDKYVSSAKFEDLRAFEVIPGDVLITSRGTIGRTALVTKGCRAGILHPCLLRVQVDPRHLGRRFLMTLVQDSALLPRQLAFLSNATTIDVIYSDTLANVLIPVPSREEQRCIGEYLSDRIGILKAATSSQATRQIELLNEYRARLIADVVTGKLDVREAAASLPEIDPLDVHSSSRESEAHTSVSPHAAGAALFSPHP